MPAATERGSCQLQPEACDAAFVDVDGSSHVRKTLADVHRIVPGTHGSYMSVLPMA